MNVISAVKLYITKMIDESGPGMKILLMDKQTTSIVSMVYSQSEILLKEVYLFERIDSASWGDSLRYLKCIAFLRPTRENVDLLCQELKNPRYGSYYIYFSNIISKADVKTLAESDEFELVKEVQEFYADYLAVSPHLVSLGLPTCSSGFLWEKSHLDRSVHGVISLLLSLRKSPIIRHTRTSEMAKRLAQRIRDVLDNQDFSSKFSKSDSGVILLIMDRREDPLTPLLTQWTYQAMVHELLTLTNNRVNMSHVKGISSELKEIVLSPEHDEFYAHRLYLNYGEIGQKMKDLMDDFQRKVKSQQKLESISDMKNFVENYPQFKKMSGTVSKHVVLISELSNCVSKRHLLEVSALEQEIACQNQYSQHLQRVRELLCKSDEKSIRKEEALKLVMLFGLKYKKRTGVDMKTLEDLLKKKGASDENLKTLHNVLNYGTSLPPYPEDKSFTTRVTQDEVVKVTKRFFKDLKGVENVYTQHTPLLKEILDDIIKGRLKENTHPYLSSRSDETARQQRVQEIIVFVVGGVTYEEALFAHQINAGSSNVRVVLGGTTIHNSESFMNEASRATRNEDDSLHNISRVQIQ